VNYYPIIDIAITVDREAEAVLVLVLVLVLVHGMHELNAYGVGRYVCSFACNFQLDNY
jgi:hypothetical protein